jgi:octaprenyl-diphosphate synthase
MTVARSTCMQSVQVQPSDDLRIAPADLLSEELLAVEELMRLQARSDVEVLEAAAHGIMDAGGKRLRPQLSLLTSLALGPLPARAIELAAAIELIHTATLVHDDIVDESDSRRGRGTANSLWGNAASVLVGDFLVSRAIGLVTQCGVPDAVSLITQLIGRMCAGEVLQLCLRAEMSTTRDQYYRIIDCKTAGLMAAACLLGAQQSGAPPATAESMRDFGYRLGLAFQIVDDDLDLFGDERAMGKPVGGDLREGKVTLPLILSLELAEATTRERIERHLRPYGGPSSDDVAAVRSIVQEIGAGDAALAFAQQHVREARQRLDVLPPSAAREALHELAGRVVMRDH